ncbi:MAG TPA: glycine--tRNA ligase subunit beta [Myxococcales bacterium]|jgi:glycyl-tRNA synthetase beta chain
MPKDLLLEIGTEELPASFVMPALDEMKELFAKKAGEARLTFGEVKVYGTPRRLALVVKDLVDVQPDSTSEVMGPPVTVAMTPDGKLTDTGEKWAAGQGIKLAQVQQKDTPKGKRVFVEHKEKGQQTAKLLPDLLKNLVTGLHFKKSMRWGWEEATFARPIQWIAALHGEKAVKFQIADVKSGNTTLGHRFLSKKPIKLEKPEGYLAAMEAGNVVVDPEVRKAKIKEAAAAEAATVGGKILDDAGLLDTVTNLVENATAVLGSFDKDYLDLPPEVLVMEAKGHQKYFSVVDDKGALMPHFVAVSNTPVKDKAVSRAGYERVLRARLSDARFFFTEDKKRPLDSRVDELKRVTFQQKLGTSYEKMARFRELAVNLAYELGLGAQTPEGGSIDDALIKAAGGDSKHAFSETVSRAAYLCKADLVTGMVGEFPELQGVMGREYTRGIESPEVSLAVSEHYLPRGASDSLPTADPGAIVGIADRLDTIVGIIGIGKAPTGAADPFALRRACLAVINITLGRGYRYSLGGMVDRALALLGSKVVDRAKTRTQVLDFFRERLKNLWADSARKDVVEAVLSAGFDDMVDAQERLKAMNAIVGRPDFDPLAVAFKRVVNIVEKQAKDVKAVSVDPTLLSEDAEKALCWAYDASRGRVETAVKAHDFAAALNEIASLKPAVDTFFNKVRVLAEDAKVKENRVALLTAIGKLFGGIADFSKIQAGEQPKA